MISVPQLEFSFYLSNSFWTAVFSMMLYIFVSNIFAKKLYKSIKNRSNAVLTIESVAQNLKIKIDLAKNSINSEKDLISEKISLIENDYKEKILRCKGESDNEVKQKILNLSMIENNKSFSGNLSHIDNLIFYQFRSNKKSIFSAIDGKN